MGQSLLLALAMLGAFGRPPGPVDHYLVDCDSGDNLKRALARAAVTGVRRIDVRGTCTGHFAPAIDGLRLSGPAGGRAVLVSDEPHEIVLDLSESDGVVLQNLAIRGGQVGVERRGTGNLSILSSEISGNGAGLLLEGGIHGYILDAEFAGNEVGVTLNRGASASVVESRFHDNTGYGLSAVHYSTLAIVDSEVTGSGQAGVVVGTVSSVNIIGSTFAENGELHAAAIDRSRFSVSGTTLGGPDDTTEFAAAVHEDSSLRSFSATTLYGDVHASDASFVTLGNVPVHGSVDLWRFSNALLTGTPVDGGVLCQSGADAHCTSVALATSGCPNAPATCGPALAPPLVRPPRAPGIIERGIAVPGQP